MLADLLIAPEARLREALRQLEDTERKVLFVADDDARLRGTLTDGDVRRWILAGGELDGHVLDVCNPNPFVVTEAGDRERLKHELLSRQITCVPVVDERGRIADVVFLDALMLDEPARPAQPAIDVPVVIMAGGKGTRLAPFTSVLPKPLIPLGDKTVIEVIVDAFRDHGVDDFYLAVNYKSRIIRSYFDELEPPYSVRFLYEEEPLGTVGALHQLGGKVDGDVIVTNCDVIVRADYHDLLRHHRHMGNAITLVTSLKHFTIPYGVCEIENGGCLKGIREKPAFDFLVNTGLYVFDASVLGLIPPGQHCDVTDLIARAQTSGKRVGVYPIGEEAWIDTGEWSEYRNALSTFTGERRRVPR